MDRGQKETERILREVEKRIDKEYSQAIEEIEAELADYLRRFELKDKKWREWVEDGTKTAEEYKQWRFGQLAVGKRWSKQKDAIAEELFKVNEKAKATYKSSASEIFAENVNFATYELEHDAKIDTSFTLYSKESVDRLIKDDPDVLPAPGKKVRDDIAKGKAVRWNRQQLQSVMIQGIIQGDSIPKLATRLANKVGDSNRKAAIRNARTMATGAQNAGRVNAYSRAESKGVEMEQMWLATLDNRTRHSHRYMDRETRPVGDEFSNGCRFPGDPDGAAAEIYNCRCALRGVVKGLERRSGQFRDDSAIGDMTYDEWKDAKPVSQDILYQDNVGKAIRNRYLREYGGGRQYKSDYTSAPFTLNGDMNKKEYVPQQKYLETTHEFNKLLDSYGLKESKWNGKIKIDKNLASNVGNVDPKDLSIVLGERSSQGTIIHELLHTRSYAYDKELFNDFKNIEEATVQMLTEEICKRNDFAFAYTYQELVQPLRTIRNALPQYETDYDFAKDLIEQPMETRIGWLYNKIGKDQAPEELAKALSALTGNDLGLGL